ncbi:response regulator transcription factor [Paenibacillus humicola]|uniref:response regulator transcription factor n=1 Tax=Paenibacillus humicola TaxID=3110540 RepID=UPI00237B292A|nr:response regulator [Paenibacillus humicola]
MHGYKLMIVDDEPEIREGLGAFDYSELGIELAGCYENGIIAYQRIQKEPVDVVVTDIRMPLMNGLELIERIRKEFGYIQTIMLTGYDDFEYARKSLQNGAVDYLLKPIDFHELKASLAKAVGVLNERQQTRLRSTILERKAKLLAKYLRHCFLTELMNRPLTPDEIEEGCSSGELLLDGGRYTVAVLRLDAAMAAAGPYTGKDWNLIVFTLDNILTEIWDDHYGYHTVDRKNGSCFLLAANPEVQSEPGRMIAILQSIRKEMLRFRGLLRSTVSIAVGPEVGTLGELPFSRSCAESLLGETPDTEAEYRSGMPGVKPAAEPDAGAESQIGRPDDPPAAESPKSLIVEEAKKYIRLHYERSITLRDVADSVHVNPTYLSWLFKKTEGLSFVCYLTDCRLNHAKRLLADPQYKVYEVGEMVGYENPRYFCEIFKKNTGKTPQEYRNRLLTASLPLH